MSSFLLGAYPARLLEWLCAEPAHPVSVLEKAKLFRGLADLTRLQILELLTHGTRSVPEIAHEIGESVLGTAAHLTCLEACGLIRQVVVAGERRYATRGGIGRLVHDADVVLAAAGAGVRCCSRYSG